MRIARAQFLISLLAFFGVFVLVAQTASAAGSITFTRKEIQESNGGWNLQMTIVYGGKPSMPHVPMRFTFTPTAFYESYLDDKHGDKPQKRTIPLVGQLPLNESVDVDFADTRGKIFDRTRFDFTISRGHNFVAGEYNVVVHRADGAAIGAPTKLVLTGDNPVIDRRAISFVGPKKEDKPAAPAAPAASEATPAAGEGAAAAGGEESPAPASSSAPAEGDPAANEKVAPSSRGCGCRMTETSSPGGTLALLALAGTSVLRARRRRSVGRAG